jgi:YegS/Rv2252/BmrU family lipid kinase
MSATTPVVIIVNPISGPRRRGPAWRSRAIAQCAEALRARGFHPEIVMTEAPAHAEALARRAAERGIPRVVAWGGDGTVNEVARGLVQSGTAFGIVPAGSGNGLARAVGLPRDPVQAAVLAASGDARPLDGGLIDGRWFFNIAGIGFDARVARVFNVAGPAARGFSSYLRVTVRELWHDRGTPYRLAVDGREHALNGLAIAIANSCEYGNGARIAPDACVDDGWLDVVAVGARGPLANLWRMRRLFDGSVARDKATWTARGRRIEVWHEGGMLFHADGDAHEARDRLVVEVVPGAVLFVRRGAPAATGGPGQDRPATSRVHGEEAP